MICQLCNKEHSVIVPTVHLNGTSAEELRRQLNTALDMTLAAIGGIVMAAPNGRDYYPQPSPAPIIVMQQHEKRLRYLNEVRAELEEMRDHVQAVIDLKEAQRLWRRLKQ